MAMFAAIVRTMLRTSDVASGMKSERPAAEGDIARKTAEKRQVREAQQRQSRQGYDQPGGDHAPR